MPGMPGIDTPCLLRKLNLNLSPTRGLLLHGLIDTVASTVAQYRGSILDTE